MKSKRSSSSLLSSDPAADGIRAAKTDAAVAAALVRGDRDELANIAAAIGFDEFARRYPAAAGLRAPACVDCHRSEEWAPVRGSGARRARPIVLNAAGVCAACVCAAEEASPAGRAAGVLQILELPALLAAVRGELDLNAIARAELASRGLNHAGQWVGFERAAALAKLSPVRRGDGSVVFVSVPESEGK